MDTVFAAIAMSIGAFFLLTLLTFLLLMGMVLSEFAVLPYAPNR